LLKSKSSLFKFIFSRAFIINIILALLFAAGVIYGIFNFLDRYTLHDQTISVPQLEGLNINDVESTLTDKKLKFIILDSIYVEKAEKGVVLEQNPSAESLVKENRTIYITITTLTPPKISMPNVVDMSQRLALAKIESYGLKVGDLKYIPSGCVNCVLKQEIDGKEVKANEKIEKGSIIDLTLGSGSNSEKVNVPYLSNLNKAEAIAKIQSSFLNFGAEIYEDCETAEDTLNAKVFKQSPRSGENAVINMGSSIDLWFTADTSKINFDATQLDSILTDSNNIPNVVPE